MPSVKERHGARKTETMTSSCMIDEVPKYGNDLRRGGFLPERWLIPIPRPLQNYRNPRGGTFQAGLYPVSANVPLGAQTGATPDGRLAHTPVADGVSPTAGRDVNGPTATANSVSKLDHGIASNGTLLNQKFHPSAFSGDEGLNNFVALIRSYFDQKGSHMQFNVVDRNTLLDAQKHPEKYKHLVVRVAGYSALFTTLSALCRMILSAGRSRASEEGREEVKWTTWIQQAGFLTYRDIPSMTAEESAPLYS